MTALNGSSAVRASWNWASASSPLDAHSDLVAEVGEHRADEFLEDGLVVHEKDAATATGRRHPTLANDLFHALARDWPPARATPPAGRYGTAVPTPISLSARIVPSCFLMIEYAVASPRPLPALLVVK